jgi:uncharacterized membrane protein
MAFLVHNELSKLTATWFNTVSIACVVVGVITPVVAIATRDDGSTIDSVSDGYSRVVWSMAGWFIAGIALHLMARTRIRRLRE